MFVYVLQWFSENEMDDDGNEEALKFKADFLYSRKNYQEAQNYFKRILLSSSRKKGQKIASSTPASPLFRDSCESYIRCLVRNPNSQCSELEEALGLVKDLIHRTNPANLEQMSNCYDMLTLVYDAGQRQPEKKAAAQISQIKLHPQVPGLWTRLAETFQLMDQVNAAESCQRQAKRLFEATEKSLPDSFVQAYNWQVHNLVPSSLAMSIDDDLEKNDLKSEVDKDFTDLGSSQLRKRKEEEVEALRKKQLETKQGLQHPPSWLEDDHCLREFIQSFIDGCQ